MSATDTLAPGVPGTDRNVFHETDEHAHAEGGSTMLGFWIYLMSDCLIFAVLFATYGVLGTSYAAGPTPKVRLLDCNVCR